MIVSKLEYKIYHLIELNTQQAVSDIIGISLSKLHGLLISMANSGLLKKVGCKYYKNDCAVCGTLEHKEIIQIEFIERR